MSLEDKAKEQIGKLEPASYLAQHRIKSFEHGYKRALKDMIEKAPKYKSIFFDSDNTKQLMEVISLKNLEQIKEDLEK